MSETDAKSFLATNTADILRGQWVDPALGERPFSEVAKLWRENLIGEDTTFDRVDSVLKCHILPTFGERPIGAIRPSAVQVWAKDRSRVLAPRTLEVVYRKLVSIFRLAVSDGLIAKSPCVGIKLPPVVNTKVKPIPAERVLAVMEALPGRYRALVVVGVGAGLRPGEAFGLTVQRIEFLRRDIHVEQQLVSVNGRAPYLRAPKRHSVRTVPVGTWVLEELARHFEEFPPVTARNGSATRAPLRRWRPTPTFGPTTRTSHVALWTLSTDPRRQWRWARWENRRTERFSQEGQFGWRVDWGSCPLKQTALRRVRLCLCRAVHPLW